MAVSSASPFFAGAVSGALSTVMFQPFDLVKTRMQMQGAINRSSRSTVKLNMMDTFVSVVQQERLLGLWKGLSPSLQRCVPGIALYFGCIETFRNIVSRRSPNGRLSPLKAFIISSSSRAIAAVTLLPFTVVKARYESGVYSYRSVYHALTSIHATDGLKGLYKGLAVTLARDLPFSSIFYVLYSQSTQYLKTMSDQSNLNIGSILVCGFSAGLIASVATQPFDVIKTNVQVLNIPDGGIFSTMRRVVKDKKTVRNLYSGLTPRVLRRTLMAAFTWLFYEQIQRSVRKYS